MSQKFCVICCYSFQEQNRSVSNEVREHFDKFCSDLGFSFPTRVDEQLENWCLKLPFGDSIGVCSDCLSVIVLYAQRRSTQLEQQEKLEELQKAVVKALKDLTVVVKDVETHINNLHSIMRNGDETCLANLQNESPKKISTRSDRVGVRSFREKILRIHNEGSCPEHTFGRHHDMIMPVVSCQRKGKLKLKVCKEELPDPIDATCMNEDDFHDPYAETADFVSMELAEHDFKDTMARGNTSSSQVRGPRTFISRRNRESRSFKKSMKKRKQLSIIGTDPNAADAYIHCEFESRDTGHGSGDVNHEMTMPLALRRTKRQIRSTLIKQEELESEDDGEIEDVNSEDDGSNFSDVDADFQLLKGKQKRTSDSDGLDSPIDSATDAESIVCDVDVFETKPKPYKKKKKHKSSKLRVSLNGMSEFKERVVNRVLRKLYRKTQGGNSANDDEDIGDGNNDSKNDSADHAVDVSNKIGAESLHDPQRNYPLKFDAETRKLTVNDIELVIDENELSLKCSLCDFSISEAEAKSMVRVRNVETVAQDHIIGSHIGSYKCGVCGKVYLTRTQFTWHKRTHREKRNNCDICGRPFNTYYDMKRHKWHHMSKEEQEEAVKNGMKDVTKPFKELKKKPRSYQCEVCGKAFRTITEVRIHSKTHSDNRERVMCNNCGKLLLPGPSMMYHELNCMKADLKDVHECYICLKKCKNKVTLGRHIKLHSAGPEILFTCSVCGKVIKTKIGLQRHAETVHSDVRPFVCEGCGSAYKLKKHLDRHQKVSCKFYNKTAVIKDEPK